VAPFVLIAGLGLDLVLIPGGDALTAGIALMIIALTWYAQAEIRWFRHDLQIGTTLATALVVRGLVFAIVLLLILTLAVGLGLRNWSP